MRETLVGSAFLTVLFLAGCAPVPVAPVRPEVAPPPLPEEARRRVAVMEFQDVREPRGDRVQGIYVTEQVTHALVGSGQFRVLDRIWIAQVLDEMKLKAAGPVPPELLGRVCAVDLVVCGFITSTDFRAETQDDGQERTHSLACEARIQVRAVAGEGGIVVFSGEGVGRASRTLPPGGGATGDPALETEALRAAVLQVSGPLVEKLRKP